MSKKVSFNAWLTIQSPNPLPGWTTERGRLTAASVEAKAVRLGLPVGHGANAWAQYQKAVGG
jgi:hypothetical protein